MMETMTTESELTLRFKRLGARSPEEWAKSQIDEGIPQLARFLFLRQAWKSIVRKGDPSWIDEQLAAKSLTSGAGPALERLLAAGASAIDLSEVVRVMQWRLLFALCYLLDDPGEVEEEVADISWRLFQVDAAGNPVAELTGLHESVLETDPDSRDVSATS